MKLCRPNNGYAPVEFMDMPEAYRNLSPAPLSALVDDGWYIYKPAVLPHIVSSRWREASDGLHSYCCVYEEYDVVQLSQEALAQMELDRQAEYAAAAAAFRALQSELDNAQLITKGLALTILDELNRITSRMRDFDAAVQAATSLADLKTRVAALSAIPARTAAQLKAAVKAKVESL
jgi:hypothetical protein